MVVDAGGLPPGVVVAGVRLRLLFYSLIFESQKTRYYVSGSSNILRTLDL